ncbi:CAMK family protein kinase [Colletotrichum sojae]|uniref:CAMK family protein kinase n=1 Tax=Colletotrichum sojae TaxID=2175907 RepID=A0A8H6J708_9PEZI|nr:CAMK family protein kinase [Colletotrichum sojae]
MADARNDRALEAQQQLDPAIVEYLSTKGYVLERCRHAHPATFFKTSCASKLSGASKEDVTFVQLLHQTDDQRREVMKIVEEDMVLSDEAAFEQHVVRYQGYSPTVDIIFTERLPGSGIEPWHHEFRDSLILDIAWDGLQALAYLHGRGVVHGSIHPGNIMHIPAKTGDHDDNGTFKLFGHGLVPKVGRHKEAVDARYTPPELRGKPYKPTFKSDVWMLGMTLLEYHELGPGAFDISLRGGIGTLVKRISERKSQGWLKQREEGCVYDAHGKYYHAVLEDIIGDMLVEKPRERPSAMAALRKLAHERHYKGEKTPDAGQLMMPVKAAVKAAKKEMRARTLVGKVLGQVKGFWDWLLLLGVALLFGLK